MNRESTWIWLIVLLCFPAFFIHLGIIPLFADEPTRALISLEMLISGNYITPTMNGELYLNKPPLYNWLLVGVFELFGNQNEFTIRILSTLPLFGFALHLFIYLKKHTSQNIALLAAFMLLTNGRILTYASFIGHIDILFSWVVFTQFSLMEKLSRQNRWTVFFIVAYLFTLIGFMFKGLPSLVFHFATLLALLIPGKNIQRIINPGHFIGIFLLILGIGSYYYAYDQKAPGHLLEMFTNLFTESSQRTPLSKGILESIGHLFVFPIEQLLHIAPWGFFIIFLFKKSFWSEKLSHPFYRNWLLIFLFNIPPYWVSPDVLPRYIFMFYPILFLFLATAFFHHQTAKKDRIIKIITWVLATLVGCASMLLPFFDFPFEAPHIIVFSIIIFLLTLLGIFGLIKKKVTPIWVLVYLMVVFRLGFSLIYLPQRAYATNQFKASAIEVAELTKGHLLSIFLYSKDYSEGPQDWKVMGKEPPFNDDVLFYITRARSEILTIERNSKKIKPNQYYLVFTKHLETFPLPEYKVYYTFNIRYQNREISLVKFKDSEL